MTKDDQEFINNNVPEASEEKLPWEKDLPEAPVSINVRGYYKGFSVQITKRNAKGEVELTKIMTAIDNMIEKGFKPSWNDDTNGKVVKAEVKTQGCPKCGGTRTFKEGVKKETGRHWAGWFCDNPDCKPEFINYASKI